MSAVQFDHFIDQGQQGLPRTHDRISIGKIKVLKFLVVNRRTSLEQPNSQTTK